MKKFFHCFIKDHFFNLNKVIKTIVSISRIKYTQFYRNLSNKSKNDYKLK